MGGAWSQNDLSQGPDNELSCKSLDFIEQDDVSLGNRFFSK